MVFAWVVCLRMCVVTGMIVVGVGHGACFVLCAYTIRVCLILAIYMGVIVCFVILMMRDTFGLVGRRRSFACLGLRSMLVSIRIANVLWGCQSW